MLMVLFRPRKLRMVLPTSTSSSVIADSMASITFSPAGSCGATSVVPRSRSGEGTHQNLFAAVV